MLYIGISTTGDFEPHGEPIVNPIDEVLLAMFHTLDDDGSEESRQAIDEIFDNDGDDISRSVYIVTYNGNSFEDIFRDLDRQGFWSDTCEFGSVVITYDPNAVEDLLRKEILGW